MYADDITGTVTEDSATNNQVTGNLLDHGDDPDGGVISVKSPCSWRI